MEPRTVLHEACLLLADCFTLQNVFSREAAIPQKGGHGNPRKGSCKGKSYQGSSHLLTFVPSTFQNGDITMFNSTDSRLQRPRQVGVVLGHVESNIHDIQGASLWQWWNSGWLNLDKVARNVCVWILCTIALPDSSKDRKRVRSMME